MDSGNPRPARKRGLGCLWRLAAGFVVLMLAIVGCGYYTVMRTAMPFRAAAWLIETGGKSVNLRITGIQGSISSGFEIESIRWAGGELADVRIKYSGLRDLVQRRELIFREIDVGKAHLDVTDMKAGAASDDRTPSATTGKPVEWPVKSLQIDRLMVEDVLVTNRATGLNLSISAIEWTGFRMAKGNMKLGHLRVDSDRVKIATSPGRSSEIEGKTVTFDALIEGTVLPRFHPGILQPVSFTLDVGARTDAGDSMTWRLQAFDGKLDVYIAQDHTGYIHCTNLDPDAYFEAPLPQGVTVEAVVLADTETKQFPMRLRGSFTLGVSRFQILPQFWSEAQGADTTEFVLAVSRSGNEEYSYELMTTADETHWDLTQVHGPWPIRQRLSAKPPLSARDTLARVFHGKSYAELEEAGRKDVDTKLPAFVGTEPAIRTAAVRSMHHSP